MNLGKKIIKGLDHLREKKDQGSPLEGQVYVVEEKEDEIFLRAEVEDFDRYSYLVRKVEISKTPKGNSPLEIQAQEIEGRVTYLLEDFSLFELDAQAKKAQLRSFPPYKRTEETHYYEILLEGGNRAFFARYQSLKGKQGRKIIPSNLSKEVLERLINDLAEVIGKES